MKILTFGEAQNPKLLLIHGFQSPWQVWTPYIEHYQNHFHILVPVMPGHDPDASDEFSSLSKTIHELEGSIAQHSEHLYAVYGMSMGGVIAASLWQNQHLQFERLILDGSPLVPTPSFMRSMMLRFYLSVTHKTQKRDKKTMEQAVGSIIPQEYFEHFLKVLDGMSDTTITNYINSIAEFKLQSGVPVSGTKIHFFHGTAMNETLAKQSARYLRKHYPDTVIHCFKGKGHCENALFHPQIMFPFLDAALQ